MSRPGARVFSWRMHRPGPEGLYGSIHAETPMALSVLIIDDELDFAEFIINGLAEEGFSVEHALDGLQGAGCSRIAPWT